MAFQIKPQEMCSIASLALFLCLGLSLAQSDVTLTFQPPGDPGNVFKKGANITVTCKAKESYLDVLQVRKMTSRESVEISTENVLNWHFKKTNRYALLSSRSGAYRQIQISIINMNGEDSGQIECLHYVFDHNTDKNIKSKSSASVIVLVPPESVEIFQYNEGDVSSVVPDRKLVLREGEDHGIICKVKVAGSHDHPSVNITLGGHNVNNRFSKEVEKVESTERSVPGLRLKNISVMYEFLTSEPNIADNGQVLKCSASTRGYDAISQEVTVKVEQGAHSPSQNNKIVLQTMTPEPSPEPTTASSAGPKPSIGESTGENTSSTIPFILSNHVMFAMLMCYVL